VVQRIAILQVQHRRVAILEMQHRRKELAIMEIQKRMAMLEIHNMRIAILEMQHRRRKQKEIANESGVYALSSQTHKWMKYMTYSRSMV